MDLIHGDVLNAVGIDFNKETRKYRDFKFIDRILCAYQYSCVVWY